MSGRIQELDRMLPDYVGRVVTGPDVHGTLF